MSYLGVGVSTGPGVYEYHHGMSETLNRRVRLAELDSGGSQWDCCSLFTVHTFRCLVRGSVLFDKPLAWLIFSADQVMAYMLVAAIGTAAQSAAFAKFGEARLEWMNVCDMYGKSAIRLEKG